MTQNDFPATPSAPSAAPVGYVTPAGATQSETPKTAAEIGAHRENFIQLILGNVTQAVQGFFTWGTDAFQALSNWATTLWNNALKAVNQIGSLIGQLGGTIIDDVGNTILTIQGVANTAAADIASIISAIGGAVATDIGNTIITVSHGLSALTDGLLHSAETVIGDISHVVADGANILQDVWDALGSAFGGAASGHNAGTLHSAAKSVKDTAGQALTVQVQQAQAKPGWLAGDSTADAVFPLSHLQAQSTLTMLSITQGDSVIGFVSTPDIGQKLSVFWLGQNTTGLTGFYINVYLLDTVSGQGTLLSNSANIISDVPNTLSWNYYAFPVPITTTVGAYYAIEMVVEGSGTYQVAGLTTGGTIPPQTLSYPHQQGAFRAPIGVFYDATGAGYSATPSANSASGSFSHTAASGACVIVSVAVEASAAPTTYTRTVTYNGVAMTSLGYIQANATGNTWVELFGALSVPGGAQTVAISVSGSATIYDIAAQSVSYTGVLSLGAAVFNHAANSSPMSTGSVSSAVGSVVVSAMIAGQSSAITVSAPSGATSRYSASLGTTHAMATSLTEAVGASTVTVTDAISPASNWGVISVDVIPTLEPAPSTLLVSEVQYSNNTPFFGLAAYLNETPVESTFSSAGTYTYSIPSWMSWGDPIDVVLLGGGGGSQGSNWTVAGRGGVNAAWTTLTLIYGVDIPLTTNTLTVTVGAGGVGGASVASGVGAYGSDGSPTTVSGTGVSTITAPGGSGGSPATNGTSNGIGPTNTVFNGVTYIGGVNVSAGNNGSAPGGGAGGAVAGHSSHPGADGSAWITSYSNGTSPSGLSTAVTATVTAALTAMAVADGSTVISTGPSASATVSTTTSGTVGGYKSASASASVSASTGGMLWTEGLVGSGSASFNSKTVFSTGNLVDSTLAANYVPVAGDLILSWFDIRTTPSYTLGTGFATAASFTSGGGGIAGWLWHTVTSAEASAGTRSWNVINPSSSVTGTVYTLALRGLNASPIMTSGAGTGSGNITTPVVTPSSATDLILCGIAIGSPYAEAWAGGSGPWVNIASSNEIGIFAYTGTVTPGSAITSGTLATPNTQPWGAITIALKD